MQNKVLKKVQYTRTDGDMVPASERIIKETALKLIVDDRHFATAMIMAAMEEEYVTGHLYVQGAINSAADIVSMEIKNNIASVRLKEGIEKRALTQDINSNLTVSKDDVVSCVRAILKSPIFTETEAVHSAGLFHEGKETVSITEDLGRQNALDKVIGAGLLKNIDFNKILAASTGRQPVEMILKCISAGIPIIVTKGVPTSMAVELAQKTGITIAGAVRENAMIVYSNPQRIK